MSEKTPPAKTSDNTSVAKMSENTTPEKMSETAPPTKTVPPSKFDQHPPSDAFFDDTIGISVGSSDPKKFHIPKALLCFYSGYFATALNGNFSEAQTTTIELKTVEPVIFKKFAYWLYTRRLVESPSTKLKDIPLTTLAKIWVFGDEHHIPLLQNSVMHLIHRVTTEESLVMSSCLKYIYKNTIPNSKLRAFAVESFAAIGTVAKWMSPENVAIWPKDALVDLARVTWKDEYKHPTKAQLKGWNMCQYHVHEEEGVKCDYTWTDFTHSPFAWDH